MHYDPYDQVFLCIRMSSQLDLGKGSQDNLIIILSQLSSLNIKLSDATLKILHFSLIVTETVGRKAVRTCGNCD